jgi:hypothetical protein
MAEWKGLRAECEIVICPGPGPTSTRSGVLSSAPGVPDLPGSSATSLCRRPGTASVLIRAQKIALPAC